MSSEMKLKPCPFCGARMIRSDEFSNRTRDIYVHELPAAGETNCPAASVILDKNSAEDWNRRVSPQPPAPAGEVVVSGALPADEPVEFSYRNWRGEISKRRVVPFSVRFGSTDWHPEPQWLLLAMDLDKDSVREFALKDIGTTPPTPDADAIRRAALEEAAKVAERRHEVWAAGDGHHDADGLPAVSCDITACENIAAAIRALATQPAPDGRG